MMESSSTAAVMQLSPEEVLSALPHRDEALLLTNQALVWPDEKRGTTTLLVTPELCAGHFPGFPVIPGHILVEAVTLLLGVIAVKCHAERPEAGMITGWNEIRFVRPARPGDLLTLTAVIIDTSCRRDTWYVVGSGRVTNGRNKLVASIGKIEIASVTLPNR